MKHTSSRRWSVATIAAAVLLLIEPKCVARLSAQEPTILKGHGHEVLSVAFSSQILASGGKDKSVLLWSADTGEQKAVLKDTSVVCAVAISPDGRTVASGNQEGEAKLWDVRTGELMHTLYGHDGGVWSVAYSPNGRLLATGSFDASIQLWDAATGEKLRKLTQDEVAFEVVFSPDGKLLATADHDNTIILWDVETGERTKTLKGHGLYDPIGIAFSPDGLLLASGDRKGEIKMWDVRTGNEIRTLTAHDGNVMSIAFSPDGKLFASAGNDGSIILWEAQSGRAVRKILAILGRKKGVRCVAFSPDSTRLASAHDDETVRIWTISGKLVGSTVVDDASDNDLQNLRKTYLRLVEKRAQLVATGTLRNDIESLKKEIAELEAASKLNEVRRLLHEIIESGNGSAKQSAQKMLEALGAEDQQDED